MPAWAILGRRLGAALIIVGMLPAAAPTSRAAAPSFPIPPDAYAIAALHDEAMAHYRERRFVEAADGFRTVMAVREGDGPARILLKRCLEYIEKPPGDDWDGAHRAESK